MPFKNRSFSKPKNFSNKNSSSPTVRQAKGGESSSQNAGHRGSGRRVQKTMDPDYSILVKKAKPQSIADYLPEKTFSQHSLHSNILDSLTKKGYEQPTPIQDKVMAHILESRDIIGIANTGTGKTAAFLLPLLHHVYNKTKNQILILAPTRELVSQIHKELISFSTKGVTSTTVIGGENIYKQINALKRNNNFIIATTGRGLDLIKQGALNIESIDTIVLDEMDQMLDMGFIRDINQILTMAKNVKHKLFFSATIDNTVEKTANELLRNPVLVSVVRGQTTDNVNQDVVEIRFGENKFNRLCELLKLPEIDKVILFENTKHGASRLEKDLLDYGFRAIAIHGNKNQNQRTRALNLFKNKEVDILIATNVAARGLDIPLVSHVINYSLPQSKEDYIHRIGRTGRAGEVGQAYTFVNI